MILLPPFFLFFSFLFFCFMCSYLNHWYPIFWLSQRLGPSKSNRTHGGWRRRKRFCSSGTDKGKWGWCLLQTAASLLRQGQGRRAWIWGQVPWYRGFWLVHRTPVTLWYAQNSESVAIWELFIWTMYVLCEVLIYSPNWTNVRNSGLRYLAEALPKS